MSRADLLALLLLILILALWEFFCRILEVPPYILPPPSLIIRTALVQAPLIFPHALVTALEILCGIALALVVAVPLAMGMFARPWLEKALSPFLVASQAIPVFALAPLLVIWLGTGRLSKIVVCALTLFFPVLVNTIVGIRSVEPGLRDLMRSLEATRWQTFTMLELPAALPVFLSGLKIGLTLSVIGAVVGEFVAADRGLGFLVNLARGLFDTPLMFVALVMLMAIALAFYLLMSLLERTLLAWQGDKG